MTGVERHAVPRRPQVPRVVGGLIICMLIAAGIAPLAGSEHGTTQVGTPDFLAGDATADGTAPNAASTSPDDTTAGGGEAVGGGPAADGASEGSGRGSTAAGPSSTAALAATDVGVTAAAIRVGFMTQNCKGCAALGMNLSNTKSSDVARVFVADLNARGGILGRKVEAFTADYDPVEDAVRGGGTQREACLELTANRKVFAVLNGGAGENSCVYAEHKTPMLIGLEPTADDPGTFNANEGRLWITGSSSARTLLNWAHQVAGQNLVSNSPTKPFAIVVGEGELGETMVRKYLIPELERLGRPPAYVAVMPANPATYPTAAATEAATMRSKQINTVMLAIDPVRSAISVQEAERNGWRPQYLVSEYPVSVSDYTGGLQPESYKGAIAVANTPVTSVAQQRADPLVRQCLAVWEKHTGQPTAELDFGAVLTYCNAVHLFEAAAKRAGTNLTRTSFVQGMAALGTVPLAGIVGNKVTFGGRYSLGSVKWSGADLQNTQVWTSPCPHEDSDGKCWVVTRGPEPLAA